MAVASSSVEGGTNVGVLSGMRVMSQVSCERHIYMSSGEIREPNMGAALSHEIEEPNMGAAQTLASYLVCELGVTSHIRVIHMRVRAN